MPTDPITTVARGLTPPDAAKRYRVSEDKVRAWIKNNELRQTTLPQRSAGSHATSSRPKPSLSLSRGVRRQSLRSPRHVSGVLRGRLTSSPTLDSEPAPPTTGPTGRGFHGPHQRIYIMNPTATNARTAPAPTTATYRPVAVEIRPGESIQAHFGRDGRHRARLNWLVEETDCDTDTADAKRCRTCSAVGRRSSRATDPRTGWPHVCRHRKSRGQRTASCCSGTKKSQRWRSHTSTVDHGATPRRFLQPEHVSQKSQTSRSQKLPPHCTRAEHVILAAMKDCDGTIPPMIAGGLVTTDFFHHAHQLCFTTLLDRFNRFQRCEAFDLYQTLDRRGELAELGPSPARWILDVQLTPPSFAGMEKWWAEGYEYPEASIFICAPLAAARLIQWLARRRAVIHAANAILRDATDGHLTPSDERLAILQLRAA